MHYALPKKIHIGLVELSLGIPAVIFCCLILRGFHLYCACTRLTISMQ